MDSAQKACLICGKSYPIATFSYHNKENRSYCPSCNKKEHSIRSREGIEAARRFRETEQSKWQ